jgi:RND family efflux transporter MFP subunit
VTVAVVLAAVRYAVVTHRKPGSMTVFEAQAMDMSRSGTPVGATPVEIERVRKRTFAPTVSTTGSAVALDDEQIYPRVAGQLTSVSVYPGDRVKAGQVVARLDSAELNSRANEAAAAREAATHEAMIATSERDSAVAESRAARAKSDSAQAALKDAQAQVQAAEAGQEVAERETDAARSAVSDAKAAVAEARADAEYWRPELAREERLFRLKAVSREELERETAQAQAAIARQSRAEADVAEKSAMLAAAQAAARRAVADVVTARARLDGSRAAIREAAAGESAADANTQVKSHHVAHLSAMAEQARAQEQTADIVRGYTLIRAERPGIVTERIVSPGTLVQPGMAILRIQDIDTLRLQANVAEADLRGIRVGSPVTVTSPRDPGLRLRSRVSSIFSAANPQTRTVTVEALAPNPGRRLLPGQYVEMEIGTTQPRYAITVPQDAVHRDGRGHAFVWTAASGVHRGKTVYTCVMHPQVEEDRPGNCPICAMKLVPKERGGKLAAHRVNVIPGPSDGARILIESGLSEGDAVITHGAETLNEGDAVTVAAWGADGPLELLKPPDEPSGPASPPGSPAPQHPAPRAPAGRAMPPMEGM